MLFIRVWILSENADFAEKAEQNNIILLKSKAIHIMGGWLPKKRLKPIIFHGSRLRRIITDKKQK
jgi:hypothetical protein